MGTDQEPSIYLPNISFLFRINNSLPCRDLNPGPPGTKQIAYQCATLLRFICIWKKLFRGPILFLIHSI